MHRRESQAVEVRDRTGYQRTLQGMRALARIEAGRIEGPGLTSACACDACGWWQVPASETRVQNCEPEAPAPAPLSPQRCGTAAALPSCRFADASDEPAMLLVQATAGAVPSTTTAAAAATPLASPTATACTHKTPPSSAAAAGGRWRQLAAAGPAYQGDHRTTHIGRNDNETANCFTSLYQQAKQDREYVS